MGGGGSFIGFCVDIDISINNGSFLCISRTTAIAVLNPTHINAGLGAFDIAANRQLIK